MSGKTIKLRLDKILAARGLHPIDLVREPFLLSQGTAYRLVNNQSKAISFKVLASLCHGLGVDPGDLFHVENERATNGSNGNAI